jgi:hypothetical protein
MIFFLLPFLWSQFLFKIDIFVITLYFFSYLMKKKLVTTQTVEEDNHESRCVQAIHHGQRLSKKLKRRLTQRTIEEVQALKKQSVDAVHILIYAAELVIIIIF